MYRAGSVCRLSALRQAGDIGDSTVVGPNKIGPVNALGKPAVRTFEFGVVAGTVFCCDLERVRRPRVPTEMPMIPNHPIKQKNANAPGSGTTPSICRQLPSNDLGIRFSTVAIGHRHATRRVCRTQSPNGSINGRRKNLSIVAKSLEPMGAYFLHSMHGRCKSMNGANRPKSTDLEFLSRPQLEGDLPLFNLSNARETQSIDRLTTRHADRILL